MNIYVGNLIYAATSQDLKDLFGQYGEVQDSEVITFRSGKSKGFGFVTMADQDSANSAINALNGKDYQGRPLIVNEARPKEDRPPRKEFHKRNGFKPRFKDKKESQGRD